MRVVTAETAAGVVRSGDTLLIGGSGGGHAVPEALIQALEARYLATREPRGLRSLHPVGLGDEATQGIDRLAHPGLLKRVVTGSLVDSPAIAELAQADEIEAYTLPQGALSLLMREMAGGRPGLITHVGLHTFIDPRVAGGRQSPSATESLVEVVELEGREWLWYKPYSVDVAFLRGTTADEDGNVTMEQEAVFGEMLSMAQATRRTGGVVIVQVGRLARRGTLSPKQVKIPGILVDLVVVDPDQWQTYATRYSAAYAGELRIPGSDGPTLEFGVRKIIARRAAMELFRGAVCNLGSGISTGISAVANEEGIADDVTLTNEQGIIGGLPAGGTDAGAGVNYDALVDQPYQFDFYDGGGLDLAFLSFAQVSRDGSVNVSRFQGRIVGVGGFVNISQNARCVVFSGTFTAGGLEVKVEDGRVSINREGRHRKFVEAVEQVSYSGSYANDRRQPRLFVTERAVLRGVGNALQLLEIAPGIDMERDVLNQMEFRPEIPSTIQLMDARLFRQDPMGIRDEVLHRTGGRQSTRLETALGHD